MLEKLLFDLGAKALPKLIAMKFGKDMADMASVAIEALGEAFGVEPGRRTPAGIESAIEAVAKEDPERARGAVAYAEAKVAEDLLAVAEVMKAGNEQQRQTNDLLREQLKQPGWRADWLPFWQWVIMGFWFWSIILVHILNAAIRIASGAEGNLPAPDLGILLTLTGIYLSLHMGGHTVLELMRGGALKRAAKGEAAE